MPDITITAEKAIKLLTQGKYCPSDIIIIPEGGSKIYAAIGVIYPEGSTLTCTNGTQTLTAKTTTGVWAFGIPEAGSWTISATDGVSSNSRVVEITTEGQFESIELTYGLSVYHNGLIDGYTFSISKDEGTATITYNETNMHVSVGSYISFGVFCREKIDVTNYSKLSITFKNGSMKLESGRNKFGLSTSTGYTDENFVASTSFNTFSGDKTLTVDISSFEGEYYLRFRGLTSQASGSFNADITRLWVE